jgi:hypothetical protein
MVRFISLSGFIRPVAFAMNKKYLPCDGKGGMYGIN